MGGWVVVDPGWVIDVDDAVDIVVDACWVVDVEYTGEVVVGSGCIVDVDGAWLVVTGTSHGTLAFQSQFFLVGWNRLPSTHFSMGSLPWAQL